MKELLFAALAALLLAGCYVGKAAFQGEEMRIYPFFSATTSASPAE